MSGTNKKWLIKIKGEDSLYYNSETKDYRLRLFCPHCEKHSTCYCYESYEDYKEDNISELPVRYCSYKCSILVDHNNWREDVLKAIEHIGLCSKPLTEYTENEAEQIIDYIANKSGFEDQEDSYGEQCET